MASEQLLAGLAGGMAGLTEGLEKYRERVRIAKDKKEKRQAMVDYMKALVDAGMSPADARAEAKALAVGGKGVSQFRTEKVGQEKTRSDIGIAEAEEGRTAGLHPGKLKEQEQGLEAKDITNSFLSEILQADIASTKAGTGQTIADTEKSEFDLSVAQGDPNASPTTMAGAKAQADVASTLSTAEYKKELARDLVATRPGRIGVQRAGNYNWPDNMRDYRSARKEILTDVTSELKEMRAEFDKKFDRHMKSREFEQGREMLEDDYMMSEGMRKNLPEPDWDEVKRLLIEQELAANYGEGTTFEAMLDNIKSFNPIKDDTENEPGEGTKVREKMGLSLPPDPQKGMERAKGLMQPSNNEDLKRELQELEEEEARLRGGA